jgi:hypothetical protein
MRQEKNIERSQKKLKKKKSFEKKQKRSTSAKIKSFLVKISKQDQNKNIQRGKKFNKTKNDLRKKKSKRKLSPIQIEKKISKSVKVK